MPQIAAGPEIPDPEYDDPKELYAFFGLASYCAGLLEASLINLLAAIRISSPGVIPAVHSDEIFDALSGLTFGQLLKETQKVVRISPATLELLEEARQKRNYLIHRFFFAHAETALTSGGIQKMIDELRDMALLFRRADEKADALWRRAWKAIGATDEQMEAALEQARRDALARDDV